ncbi:MAG TPA: DUF3043 domain-containing protein [Streptosporangiaceae bacterium]|nr:DUF3043 domain-containing protein [Streptosporangiaceae bacterium]
MLLRRRAGASAAPEPEQASPADDRPAKQAGKGRPTPKRSEVERARRQPYTAPPADKKQAAAQRRDRQRAEQKRRSDAMRRGEEWALPARDRGAVRALARDYIDSRRLVVSEYILFGVVVLIIAIFALGSAKHSTLILYIELAIVGIIAVESLYHGAMVTRLAKQRLPGESTKGISWYIAKRSLRLRASRIPPARVDRGAAI